MSDFELLKALQKEFIDTLSNRKKVVKYFNRTCCKAKIHRLRIQIQELMLRIEDKCEVFYKDEKEKWE